MSTDRLAEASDAAPAGADARADTAADGGADTDADAELQRQQRLQRLMQAIDAQPDFASTKSAVGGIQAVSRSERAHTRALEHLIHDDAAAAGKLLRLINAAFYRSVGGGEISSVQRAIALMGFRSVGMLAGSLMLYERLPKGSDGDQLRRGFARSQLAALLAHEFCHARKLQDSIYIVTMFHRLGEMLAGLHAGDELRVIDDQLDERELAAGTPQRLAVREQLARERWGLGLAELGAEVAARWGWPPEMLSGMRQLTPADPEQALSGDDYLRALCTGCTALADELMRLPATGSADDQLAARAGVVARFAASHAMPLGLNPEGLAERVEHNHAAWNDLVQVLGIALNSEAGSSAASATADAAKRPEPGSLAYRQALASDLADAVDRLTRMNNRGAALNDVLEETLRRMLQALDLQRAIVCLRDAHSGALKGRFGLGERAVVLAPHFDIPLQPPADLFGLLCLKNADTLISDTADPIIAQRLPPWFTQKVRAGAFVLLPLMHDGVVLGLIYGDQRDAGRLQVHDRGLTLLKNLRAQVLRAMLRPAA